MLSYPMQPYLLMVRSYSERKNLTDANRIKFLIHVHLISYEKLIILKFKTSVFFFARKKSMARIILPIYYADKLL